MFNSNALMSRKEYGFFNLSSWFKWVSYHNVGLDELASFWSVFTADGRLLETIVCSLEGYQTHK